MKDINLTLNRGQLLYPQYLVAVGKTVYFSASDFTHGTELWKSDGTMAGTALVSDIVPGTGSSFPSGVTNVNGTLFFVADDGISGQELWKSDGTATGTARLRSLDLPPPVLWPHFPPLYGASFLSLTNIHGTLFFSGYTSDAGYELWKSDGTAEGTTLVKDINPGPHGSNAAWLTDVNGTLFFAANDGARGLELWKSDGTPAGTTQVTDLVPGAMSSFPAWLANVHGRLFFAARDAVSGDEIWQSDGTTAGTKPVADMAAGVAGSDPSWLTLAGGYLFFSADDGSTGQELWAIRSGVDAYLQTPTWSGAAPGGAAAIPIRYGNLGLSSANALTLTATLDSALMYVDDTAGITPTIQGRTIQWRLPAAGFNARTDIVLRVRLPNAPIGTSYPITMMLTAAAETYPIDNTQRVEVMIARQVFVPTVEQERPGM